MCIRVADRRYDKAYIPYSRAALVGGCPASWFPWLSLVVVKFTGHCDHLVAVCEVTLMVFHEQYSTKTIVSWFDRGDRMGSGYAAYGRTIRVHPVLGLH